MVLATGTAGRTRAGGGALGGRASGGGPARSGLESCAPHSGGCVAAARHPRLPPVPPHLPVDPYVEASAPAWQVWGFLWRWCVCFVTEGAGGGCRSQTRPPRPPSLLRAGCRCVFKPPRRGSVARRGGHAPLCSFFPCPSPPPRPPDNPRPLMGRAVWVVGPLRSPRQAWRPPKRRPGGDVTPRALPHTCAGSG